MRGTGLGMGEEQSRLLDSCSPSELMGAGGYHLLGEWAGVSSLIWAPNVYSRSPEPWWFTRVRVVITTSLIFAGDGMRGHLGVV